MNFKKALKTIFSLRDRELFNHAAALSFHTFLSLIPILFVCFSAFMQIPSLKNHYEKAKSVLFSFLIPTQQEIFSLYLDSFLKNSLNLGIIGLAAMIFTSLAFFSSYNFVISRLAQSEPKGFWQSISSYWTLLTLVPLGLGLSFYISNLIQNVLDAAKISLNLLAFLPFLIIWALFFISYSSSINRAKLLNLALISFGASALWYIGKNLFIYYVVSNRIYSSIYGSFSALLFFFLWVYISWVIYLFGLKFYVFFSKQNPNERDKIYKNAKKS